MKKGEVWISAVLYVLVIVALIVLVLEAGLPLLDSLRERNALNRAQETLTALDSHIRQIASEGQGSQRVVPIAVSEGEVKVRNSKLQWKLETDSELVEPGTRSELGNVVVSADVDVSVSQTATYHILENSRIRANFTRVGSESNFSSINTSNLLQSIFFKDTSTQTSGSFIFTLNNSQAENNGTGYTKLLQSGDSLAEATLLAHINATTFEYDLHFTLPSKADFLQVDVKNFRRK